MRKTIELRCAEPTCGKLFRRYIGEHNRSLKLGRAEYCSRTCQGDACENLGAFKGKGHVDCLRADNRRDEYTGFRYYLRKAKDRIPESNITLADIKLQWERQQGRCAYTQLPITLKHDNGGDVGKKPYQIASLDRIDSAKPYNKGNIQFVSLSINLMKSTMSDEETKEFLVLIRA